MKVQNLLFLKMLVLLFSALLKKFGGLISNVMSLIESKNPHSLSPLGVNTRLTRASINGHRFVEVTYAKEALFYQSSRQHNIRHVACTTRPTRAKGYFAMRITRYPNSDLTFGLQRLLSCGDVSTNP